jgi:hypothetical protein
MIQDEVDVKFKRGKRKTPFLRRGFMSSSYLSDQNDL